MYLTLIRKKDLAGGPQIILAPVAWGVRGTMNGWGFTEMEQKEENGTIIFTAKNCELPANGDFKFAYGGGWKITLDDAGKVKANTNLGWPKNSKKGLAQGGDNIKVEKGGTYDITLKFKLMSGELGASYTCETKLIKEAAPSALPTKMFMIGAEFGNWKWEDSGVVEMIPFNSQPGMFWAVRYLTANKGFKFSPAKDWNGGFSKLTDNQGIEFDSDNNAIVKVSGIYCIGVDCKNSKIVIEKASVYGIGDAFGGWKVKTNAYKEEGKVMTIKATADGNMRSYVASSILDKQDNWWHAEFIINNGKIEYRGAGNDPAAIPVKAGQTITLDFNAGTGTIK